MKQRQLKLICSLCAGSGWLCDEHPTSPWGHDEDCDGGGTACHCNELATTPHRVVFVENDAFDSGMH